MSGLVSIFKREIFDRRELFIAALVAACLPPLIALLPRFQALDPVDVRSIIAVLFAAGFALFLVVYLGTSMISRDLAEGRLGFYFSRPFSAAAIWWGKVGGALVVTILLPIVVLLPTYLINRGAGIWAGRGDWQSVLLTVLLMAVSLLTVHSLSIILRSNSPWLVFHSAVFLCVAWLVWRSAEIVIMIFYGYRGLDRFLELILLPVLVVLTACFLLAGFVQVKRGRADLRSSSSSLAWSVSSVLLAIAVVFTLYVEWLRRPQIDDLKSISYWYTKASESNWLEINGQVRRGGLRFHSFFLYNTATGAWIRRGNTIGGLEQGFFSGYGSRTFWLSRKPGILMNRKYYDLPADLSMFDLRSQQPQARMVIPAIVGAGQSVFPFNVTVSKDGGRVALIVENILSVYEVDSGAQICVLRIGSQWRNKTINFVNRDRLRLYHRRPLGEHSDEQILGIAEVYLPEKKIEELAQIEPVSFTSFVEFLWHPSADRLLVKTEDADAKRWQVRDGRSGVLIIASGPIEKNRYSSAMILHDGSLIVGRNKEDRIILEQFTETGDLRQPIDLGPGTRISLGAEIAPEKLVVARNYSYREDPAGRTLIVDMASGKIQPILSEAGEIIEPVWFVNNWFSNPTRTIPKPGSVVTRLFVEHDHRVFRFDPETGEQTTLFTTDGD